jgi:hypothetical protein
MSPSSSWNEKSCWKKCRENQNTRVIFNNLFNRAVCKINVMWKNNVKPDTPWMAIWRKRIACLITKDKETHLWYVINNAFHGNSGYANAPQCYFLATLPFLFHIVGAPFCLTPKWSVSVKHSDQNLYTFLVTSVPANSPSNPAIPVKTKLISHFVRLADYEAFYYTSLPGFLLLELEKIQLNWVEFF